MEMIQSIKDYFSVAANRQREINEEESALALNAWHLARYVMEQGKYSKKVKDFDFGEFFAMCEKYPDMPEGSLDKVKFVNNYHKLELIAENVTARTLIATRIHGRGFVTAVFGTSIGQYLLFLSLITFLFIVSLAAGLFWPLDEMYVDLVNGESGGYGYYFFYFLAQMSSSSVMAVFCAAGLGTTVYLLRETQKHLTERTFDPARIPGHCIRLLLGVVAGGTIVLFPDIMGSINNLKIDEQVGIGQGALAFILGYGVEIFYEALDSLKEKLRVKQP